MAGRIKPIQENFLNKVLVKKNDNTADKRQLTVFLVNGVKLTGNLVGFDNFSIVLSREGHSQLIYKHAISTIVPGFPLEYSDLEDNSD